MTKEQIHQEAIKRSNMGICNAFSFIMGASWASEEQQNIDIKKACDTYCNICDTQECAGTDSECHWVKRFRDNLIKAIEK